MIPSQKIIIMTKDRDNDLRNSSSQERQSKHKKRSKRKWELGENGKPSCALPPQQTSMWWRAAPRKPDYNFNRSRLDLKSFKKKVPCSPFLLPPPPASSPPPGGRWRPSQTSHQHHWPLVNSAICQQTHKINGIWGNKKANFQKIQK